MYESYRKITFVQAFTALLSDFIKESKEVPSYKIEEEYFDGEKTIFIIKLSFKNLAFKKSSFELKSDKKLLAGFCLDDKLRITDAFVRDSAGFKYELHQTNFNDENTFILKDIQTGESKKITLSELVSNKILIKAIKSEHAFQLGYMLRENDKY